MVDDKYGGQIVGVLFFTGQAWVDINTELARLEGFASDSNCAFGFPQLQPLCLKG